MSTLKVSNIQATGETASRAVSGVAAAWVNFNGTGTVAIRDSFNNSSLTDDATGKYSVTITNAMSDGDYSLTLGAGSSTGTRNTNLMIDDSTAVPTATSVKYIARNENNTDVDCNFVFCNWTGDLA